MHNKELFLLLIFFSHYTHKVLANIDNETIRLQLKKNKVWNKGTNTVKVLLVEWIKSRNYKKIKSENSISKSCWCNTLVTTVPPLSRTLLSPDVSHKYFIRSEIFNSLHIPHCFLYYPHKFGNPSLLSSNMELMFRLDRRSSVNCLLTNLTEVLLGNWLLLTFWKSLCLWLLP